MLRLGIEGELRAAPAGFKPLLGPKQLSRACPPQAAAKHEFSLQFCSELLRRCAGVCRQEPALAVALAKAGGLLQAAAEHCCQAGPRRQQLPHRQASRMSRSQRLPTSTVWLVRGWA